MGHVLQADRAVHFQQALSFSLGKHVCQTLGLCMLPFSGTLVFTNTITETTLIVFYSERWEPEAQRHQGLVKPSSFQRCQQWADVSERITLSTLGEPILQKGTTTCVQPG